MSNPALHVQPGERFGLLVVVARTGRRDEKGHAILELACDCGETGIEKNSTSLRSGRVRSCGCLKSPSVCRHGHAFTPDNTRVRPTGRRCLACKRRHQSDWRARRAAARAA